VNVLPLVANHNYRWFALDMVIMDDLHACKRFNFMVRELKGKGIELLAKPFAERKYFGNKFVDMVAKASVSAKLSLYDSRFMYATTLKKNHRPLRRSIKS
jgi:hypothetical protein